MTTRKPRFSRQIAGPLGLGLALCISGLPALADSSPGFTIVENGRPLAAIVLPNRPLLVESYAARELASHIQKATSVNLPIIREKEAGSVQHPIYIGNTDALGRVLTEKKISLRPWRTHPLQQSQDKFPPNGYLVKSLSDGLFLAGRDDTGLPLTDTVSAGTLFAVYEWLEGQLGVRWIWPGELGTKIPAAARISSGQWNLQGQPPLPSTKMRRSLGSNTFTPTEGGFTAEQRKAAIEDESIWYRRNRFARSINLDYGGHAFEGYWKRFNQTNPEFFNLLPDGHRRPSINERVISMSVANQGFQRQVVEDWKVNRTPERPWINAVENDTSGLCVCPECLASDVKDPEVGKAWDGRVEKAREAFKAEDRRWYLPLGSLSDRYARYYLGVQQLARETDPNATVIAYAYLNYRNPPLATRLNKNIVIGIIPEAPDPLSYLWPLNDETFEGFKRQWTGWSNSGAMLYLRPNYLISGHEQPLVFPQEIGRYFQLAYKNSLMATDYDSFTSMWATQGPNLYVATRLHWHPDWPIDRVLSEYYDLFGPASRQVKAYFDFWQGRTTERGRELLRETEGPLKEQIRPLFLKWSNYYQVTSLVFTPEDFANGQKLLAAATKAAGKDEITLRRINFLAAGLEDARLVAEASAIGLKMDENSDIGPMSRVVAALDDHRRAVAKDYPQAVNLDLAAFNENRTWDRLIYNALAGTMSSQRLPLTWSLRWDPERRGGEEEWFKQVAEDNHWNPIEVTSPWEKQNAGRAWKQKTGSDYDGLGWYQVKFKPEAKFRGRPLSLLFGAADESASVYLNGKLVGSRLFTKPDDWKTPFSMDVTNGVDFNGENTLTVLVEDKSGLGGLWKPVWLVERKGP